MPIEFPRFRLPFAQGLYMQKWPREFRDVPGKDSAIGVPTCYCCMIG
jgi:hypothetical protein